MRSFFAAAEGPDLRTKKVHQVSGCQAPPDPAVRDALGAEAVRVHARVPGDLAVLPRAGRDEEAPEAVDRQRRILHPG